MNVSSINSSNPATLPDVQNVQPLTRSQRARASHLSGEALRNASPAEQRAAVASQFEAVLVRQMLGKTLTSMLGKDDNAATSVYGDLLTDTFSKQLTAGSGLGLASVIEKQMTPRAPIASAKH